MELKNKIMHNYYKQRTSIHGTKILNYEKIRFIR